MNVKILEICVSFISESEGGRIRLIVEGTTITAAALCSKGRPAEKLLTVEMTLP
jgi:hypothetical protein